MTRMTSTGEFLLEHLEENNINLLDVAKKANVSIKTIYRIINNERRVDENIAKAIEELIPGLKAETILIYDLEYNLTLNDFLKENDIKEGNVKNIIKTFSLDKLFQNKKTNKIYLINKGLEIFGKDAIINNSHNSIKNFLSFNFNKAKNPKDNVALNWCFATYWDYLDYRKEENLDLYVFNKEAFEKFFKTNLKDALSATTIEQLKSNMDYVAKTCGINIYFKESIPNARVKGVTFKDKNGYVFLFVSDLFKCLENLELTLAHEFLHIKHNDISKININEVKNEKEIEEDAIKFFIGDEYNALNETNPSIYDIALNSNTEIGIVAEIIRNKKNKYSDNSLKAFVHYFKDFDFKEDYLF